MSSTTTPPQSQQKQTTYLLTGANRGLGLALSILILSRPNTLLIALVRNPTATPDLDALIPPSTTPEGSLDPGTTTEQKPDDTSTTENENLPTPLTNPSKNTTLLKLPYDASHPPSAPQALEHLQTHSITHLDIIIANAGVCSYFGPSTSAPTERFTHEYQINALAPLQLFSACHPLMHPASAHTAPSKFFAISSAIGSTSRLTQTPGPPAPSYGASKAALNHLVVRLHTEHPHLIIGLLTPGRTRTGFARAALEEVAEGMRRAGVEPKDLSGLEFHSPEESARGVLGAVEGAGKEDGGVLRDWCDGVVAW